MYDTCSFVFCDTHACMWREKVQEKTRARTLRSHGKSLNEIVKEVGVSKNSVSIWVQDVLLTAEQKRELRNNALVSFLKSIHPACPVLAHVMRESRNHILKDIG